LPEGYGCESADWCFQGDTIYNDAALGCIWGERQILLGVNETVMGKSCFGQWLWDMAYAEVKHYHGDNGIFSAEEYCKERLDKVAMLVIFNGWSATPECLGRACYPNDYVQKC
jgi:hypothetical protein